MAPAHLHYTISLKHELSQLLDDALTRRGPHKTKSFFLEIGKFTPPLFETISTSKGILAGFLAQQGSQGSYQDAWPNRVNLPNNRPPGTRFPRTGAQALGIPPPTQEKKVASNSPVAGRYMKHVILFGLNFPVPIVVCEKAFFENTTTPKKKHEFFLGRFRGQTFEI